MKNWAQYWSRYPKTFEETEFLKQVATTVKGEPYSPRQFDQMVEGITLGRSP